MIEIIIFSYNRAMQLNTLLKSIKRHWESHSYQISILYNCSDCNYAKGYEILKRKYPNVKFVRENKSLPNYKLKDFLSVFNLKRFIKYSYVRHPKSDFRDRLIEILSQAEAELVMFLTDDSQFITDVEIEPRALNKVSSDPYHTQYSLRLGQNINNPGKVERFAERQMTWSYNDPQNQRDWRYNFSVDAHIYDKKVILDLAKRILFTNPNSYESFTTIYCRKKGWLNKGIANMNPSILSFPINMVQEVQDNESLTVSTEALEKWLEEGYELDYPIPDCISTFQQYPKSLVLHGADGDELIETEQ